MRKMYRGKKMWSIRDNQVGRIMASGRNSKTKEKAIEEIIDYLQHGDSITKKDMKKIQNYTLKEKEKLIKELEFKPFQHEEKIRRKYE